MTARSPIAAAVRRLRTDPALAAGLGILALLALAVYLPVVGAGFVWDDDVHLTGNPYVTSWGGLVEIWTSRAAMYYPLTLTLFWGLEKVVGVHPLPYHLLNLGLHLANAALVWWILRELRVPGAYLAAVLFLVHPVQVETAAWVTETKNTLSGLFALGAFGCLVRSGLMGDRHAGPGGRLRPRWYRAGCGLFLLALLAKTAVVMLPAVVLVAMLCLERNWRGERLRAMVPLFALSLGAALWTIWEQRFSSGAHGFEWSFSFLERIALAGQIVWFYLGKLAWPFPVMFQYPMWEVRPVTPRSVLPLLAALVLLGVPLLMPGNRARYLFLALASFAILIFPVLGLFNIYFFRYAYVADHFLYLAAIPVFGIAGAVAAGAASRLASRVPVPPAVLLAAVGVLAVVPLGVAAHRHARHFQTAEALWTSAIAANPDAWLARNNLGLILQNRGDLRRARDHYLAALAANPRHYEAMTNLGTLLLDEGRVGEARDLFARAAALQPLNPVHHINLGHSEQVLGNLPAAEQHFRTAVEVRPEFAEGWLRLARLADGDRRVEEAIPAYREGLSLQGHRRDDIARYFGSRAEQALRQARPEEARLWLAAAERLAPTMPELGQLRRILPPD